MFEGQSGWAYGVVISLLAGAIARFRGSAELALGTAVITSLVFPDWIKLEIYGAPFGIRTSVAAISLSCYIVFNPRRFLTRLNFLDAAIAIIAFTHLFGDVSNGRSWDTILMAYGEWALPYIVGRLAARDALAFSVLRQIVCCVLIIWSVGAVTESLTSTNPWELLFGARDGEFPRDASRYGFKRAFGNAEHPIFFGLQISMLLPWALALINRHERRNSWWLGVATTLVAVAGSLATLSRGPIVTVGAMLLLAAAYRYWWGRILLAVAILAIGIPLAINPITFLTRMGSVVQEGQGKITLDGQQLPTNGTLVRIWLVRAYMPALKGAGLLGYGTEAVKFPVNVPHLPNNIRTTRSLRWIDNGYLLIGLRFGWLGIFALGVLLSAGVYTSLQIRGGDYESRLGIWTATSIIAMALALLTVWLSYDFCFDFLWQCGVINGILIRRGDRPVIAEKKRALERDSRVWDMIAEHRG